MHEELKPGHEAVSIAFDGVYSLHVPSRYELFDREGRSRLEYEVPIYFKKLHPDAVVPSHATFLDAGADLFAAESVTIPPRGHALVPTGLSVAFPAGYYMRISSRSGLSLKRGIEVGAGTVDAGYRGPLGVVLYNHTDIHFVAEQGMAIAQAILLPYERQNYIEVDELPPSTRGTGGFGSSGR